ncbi:MAG TPA: lysozyme inhibitor LprI family protein [Gemmatimonadaceae bacterium]
MSNQREETACVGAALDTTERNFGAFYGALENFVGGDAVRGAQTMWLDYRKKQCEGIFNFFRRGTIAPSARIRCEIALTRSRMRDLDALFDVQLHH